MSDARLSASVIVTTRNRASHLRRLLPSLCQLSYEPLEVVVVVGPSEDDTLDVIEEYRDRVKVVMSPAANMCLSRNLGLAVAAGDVVVFIDDDGIPETREWIQALVAPFARDERVGAAGGPVLYQDSDAYQFRNGIVSEYGEHVFTAGPSDAVPAGPGWFRRAMGTNAAFRRHALLRIGGFDERIVYYGDECDVCVRLAVLGYEFAFVEGAAVRHYPASSPHRHLVNRTRTVTHDDTYFCLRNAGAPLPLRLFRTLLKAPRKHYVQEAIVARHTRTLTFGNYCRFWWLWLRGLCAAVGEALFTKRRLMTPSKAAPALLPLKRVTASPRLSIALTARQLACDGPCEGPARYTFDLAEGLHALGHDVHVIGESPVPKRHLRLGFTVHGVAPAQIVDHVFPAQPILDGNVAYALAVARRFRELAQAGVHLDVVHTTNWNFEGLGILIDGRVPVVMMLVTSLAEVVEYERWTRNDDLDAGVCLDRAQMRAAAAVTAPTAGLVRKYVETRLVDADLARRVVTTPLGIVPRRVSGASETGHRLLFVGTHVRRKGLDDLLAVLPELLSEQPGWTCDIAGDDTRVVEDGLTLKEQFLRQHGGQPWLSRVTFHGRIPDRELWRLYAGASLYAVPSRFESFGLTYLEAMQFGVPVVATRAGGIPEVVQEAQTGLLVDAGDRAALRTAISRLMSDDSLRTRLGEAARRDVLSRWTHVHMAQRLLSVYAKAREGYRPAGAERPDAPGRAIVDLIAGAGAAPELVARLRESMTFEGGHAERRLLVNAALGRLPDGLYVPAVEACLERGEAARAARLIDDALALAPCLAEEARAELAELQELATELAPVDHTLAAETSTKGATSGVVRRDEVPATQRVEEAVSLLREGRVSLGIARLFRLVEDDGLPPVQRLTAGYHLASGLKRCGFAAEAHRRLRRIVSDPEFARVPGEVRAAAWFHAADLARAAGRLDEADEGFSRCLELNPLHGRAAALRSELRQPRVAGPGRR